MGISAVGAQSPVQQGSGPQSPNNKKLQMLEKKQEQIQQQIRRTKQDKSLSKEELQKKLADLEKQLENISKQIQDLQQASPAQAGADQTDRANQQGQPSTQELTKLEAAQQAAESQPVSALDDIGLDPLLQEGGRPGRFDQFVQQPPMEPSLSGIYQLQRDEDGAVQIVPKEKEDSRIPAQNAAEQQQEKENQLPEDLLALLRENQGKHGKLIS